VVVNEAPKGEVNLGGEDSTPPVGVDHSETSEIEAKDPAPEAPQTADPVEDFKDASGGGEPLPELDIKADTREVIEWDNARVVETDRSRDTAPENDRVIEDRQPDSRPETQYQDPNTQNNNTPDNVVQIHDTVEVADNSEKQEVEVNKCIKGIKAKCDPDESCPCMAHFKEVMAKAKDEPSFDSVNRYASVEASSQKSASLRL
jgi:hypothetical protein